MADIKEVSYKKYQLQWMIDHGYTIEDLIKELQKCIDEVSEEEKINLAEIYDDWEFGYGFGSGSIWVCYDEFLDCEYRDNEYMKYLLADREYDLYLLDIKQLCDNKRSV